MSKVTSPTLFQASMILPDNHINYNTPIETQAMVLRNDPDDSDDHPEFYCLQKAYRDNEGYSTFPNQLYNYVAFKLDPYLAFMNLAIEPAVIASSGIINCRCQLLDQYDFSIADRNVHWSKTGDGTFLGWPGEPDPDDIETDDNGISYNRLQVGSNGLGFYQIETSAIIA